MLLKKKEIIKSEGIIVNKSDRAKQFMPFDTLKGLHDALRMKEYEHDRLQKGDLGEEKIKEISSIFLSLKKGQTGQVVYFDDGYYKTVQGKLILNLEMQQLKVDSVVINLENIFDVALTN